MQIEKNGYLATIFNRIFTIIPFNLLCINTVGERHL